jgi:hypothetical protein
MTRAKSRSPSPLFETLYFQIGSAKREYAYGIEHAFPRRRPRLPTSESDSVLILGSIRHAFRQPITCCEIKLAGEDTFEATSATVQRSIGFVDFVDETVRAYVWVPVQSLRRLASDLTQGQFKEVSLRLIDIKRRRALIDCINFESDLTPSEDFA